MLTDGGTDGQTLFSHPQSNTEIPYRALAKLFLIQHTLSIQSGFLLVWGVFLQESMRSVRKLFKLNM